MSKQRCIVFIKAVNAKWKRRRLVQRAEMFTKQLRESEDKRLSRIEAEVEIMRRDIQTLRENL